MGDLSEYLRAGWDLTPQASMYIESVHQMSDHGAVVTWAAWATSAEGFIAEWRSISLVMVEGDLISHAEMYDEVDLDAALARFDELAAPPRQLESPATQAYERYRECYTARDWDALAQTIAPDFLIDDRRRPVNAGITQGRDSVIEIMKATADLGNTNVTSTVLATRGERLILTSAGFSDIDQGPEAFRTEVLSVSEILTDNRLSALVLFDREDIDAAFAELDSRYLRGQASAHAHAWSVLTGAYRSINRHEDPPTASGWVNLDHRRATSFAPGELLAYLHAAWEFSPEERYRIETVHRLTDYGAVVSHAANGTSRGGFDAEWRVIMLFTIDGDLINRFEAFDEADIDTAIARFDELTSPARQLENMATRVVERVQACLAARDWGTLSELVAGDISTDDRRRVVNAGIRHGRDAEIESMRAIADLGVTLVMSSVIATRGNRLVLLRMRLAIPDQDPQSFDTESLVIVEVDADERISSYVVFDSDDIDAAFAELETRYLAGEAAAHAHTWSVIAQAFAALNRHEMPPIDAGLGRTSTTDRLPRSRPVT